MAVQAFLTFFDKADGESVQKGKEKWVELQGWNWDIDAETSWTKGGGASVGKPTPGRMSWTHRFDTTSPVIMGYLCSGKAFPKAEVQMLATSGAGVPETYFTMSLDGVYATKVSTNGLEDGSIVQLVEMVFKAVKMECRPRDPRTGKPGQAKTFSWDIPAGTASPSARVASGAKSSRRTS